MHIERTGQGPSLVMIHGWAMHSGIWGELREQLAEHFTLLLVDLPGHGRSRDDHAHLRPESVAAEIAGHCGEGALWMGWSLGGMIAMQAAMDHPTQVGGLICVAASPRFTQTPTWPHGVSEAVIAQFERDLRTDFDGTLRRFIALEVHGCDTERQDLRLLRNTAFAHGAPAPRVLAEGLELLHHLDLRERVEAIRCPTLFIAGRRDKLVPYSACQAAAQMIQGARCEVMAGSGHAPFIGHPNTFRTLVLAFANSIAPAMPATATGSQR